MDAREILKRYAAGQRDFSRVSLIQVSRWAKKTIK